MDLDEDQTYSNLIHGSIQFTSPWRQAGDGPKKSTNKV